MRSYSAKVEPDTVKVGLLGCGVVGTGVLKLLAQRGGLLAREEGVVFQVKRIAVKQKDKPRDPVVDRSLLTGDLLAVAGDPGVDMIVEVMGGKEPALTALRQALEAGKDVVTANKLVLAEDGEALEALAREKGRFLAYEGSVAAAIPIIQALDRGMVAEKFQSLLGILNGTTNYILCTMERESLSYAEALKEAQNKGFAEADPTLDVSGMDATQKLAILVRKVFGIAIHPERIPREGIEGVSSLDIENAGQFGYRIKLLGIARRINGKVEVGLRPTLVSKRHILADVWDEFNAVALVGENCGPLLFYGRGAGQTATANAVLADMVALAKLRSAAADAGRLMFKGRADRLEVLPREEAEARFYLRFALNELGGASSKVTTLLEASEVRVAKMIKTELAGGKQSSLVILTHRVREGTLRETLREAGEMKFVLEAPTVIRIED